MVWGSQKEQGGSPGASGQSSCSLTGPYPVLCHLPPGRERERVGSFPPVGRILESEGLKSRCSTGERLTKNLEFYHLLTQ